MALSLVSTNSFFPNCANPDGNETDCSCVRVQVIKTGTGIDSRIRQDTHFHTGAIIIGERILNHISRSKFTEPKPVVVSILADTTSNLAQLVIPSGESSHNQADHGKDGIERQLGMFNVPTIRPGALSPSLNVDKMYQADG